MRKISGDITENSEEIVAAIIHNVTGLKTISSKPITGRGFNNSVTLATTTEGRFVVRTNVESHLFRFERESWLFKQLENTPVLTPTVLGCGVINNHSYSVAHFIKENSPIHSDIDEKRVWKTLGSYANVLNKIAVSLIDDDSRAHEYFPVRWKEQVQSDHKLIFQDDFWVKKGILTSEKNQQIQRYLEGAFNLNIPHGVCQFDMTPANALICDSDYDRIYLIDLEWANIAPVPHYQLACIAAEKGPQSEASKSYFRGYGLTDRRMEEIAPDLHLLTLHRLMRATAWARDRRPELLEENINRTQPLLDETFLYLNRTFATGS